MAMETHTVRVNNNFFCTWGNNITFKNITIEYYLNTTWLATGIDRKPPTDEELFGDTGVMR